jgi:hypothetical protein
MEPVLEVLSAVCLPGQNDQMLTKLGQAHAAAWYRNWMRHGQQRLRRKLAQHGVSHVDRQAELIDEYPFQLALAKQSPEHIETLHPNLDLNHRIARLEAAQELRQAVGRQLLEAAEQQNTGWPTRAPSTVAAQGRR